jgi:hypothetical protein
MGGECRCLFGAWVDGALPAFPFDIYIFMEKALQKVAKIHARITDRRRDFSHKLSTRLIRENQTICFEACGEAVRPGAVKAKPGRPQRNRKPKGRPLESRPREWDGRMSMPLIFVHSKYYDPISCNGAYTWNSPDSRRSMVIYLRSFL